MKLAHKALITIGVVVLIIAAYFFMQDNSSESPDTKSDTSTLRQRYVAAEGKVETFAGLDVDVGSELIGRIDRFYVKEGDRVSKGGIIAVLDNRDIQARLKEAEGELLVAKAKLKEVASGAREEEIKRARAVLEGAVADMDLAKTELERYRQLHKEGIVPESMLDEKEKAFKVAAARVKEADEEKRLLEKGPRDETLRLLEETVAQAESTVEYYKRLLEKTIIKSPISGKLINRYLEEGEAVTPEIPIASVADVEKIRINAEVDETDAGMIKTGDPAEVTSDAFPGTVFKGEIEEIADYVGVRKIKPNNPAKNVDMKVIQVKIRLKEKTPLKLGMTVDVRIKPGNSR